MPWRTATILLVDDEQPILDILSEFLTEVAEIKVLTALNGQNAMAILEAHPEINLMVTDMLMPVMGGAELAQRAITLRPELKVLLVSGSWSLIQMPEGTWPILAKPFTLNGLLEKIKEVVVGNQPPVCSATDPAPPDPMTRS